MPGAKKYVICCSQEFLSRYPGYELMPYQQPTIAIVPGVLRKFLYRFLNTVCKLIHTKKGVSYYSRYIGPPQCQPVTNLFPRVRRVNAYLCLSICEWKQVLALQTVWKQNTKKHSNPCGLKRALSSCLLS